MNFKSNIIKFIKKNEIAKKMVYSLETITYSKIELTPTGQRIIEGLDTILNYTKIRSVLGELSSIMTTDITELLAKDYVCFKKGKERPYVPGSKTPKRKKGKKGGRNGPHVNKYSKDGPRRGAILKDKSDSTEDKDYWKPPTYNSTDARRVKDTLEHIEKAKGKKERK